MPAFEPLHTPRLTLRLLDERDAADINAYQRLPEVVEYMLWEVRNLAETREHLAKRLNTTALEKDGDVLVVGVELAGAGHPHARHAAAPPVTHAHATPQLGGDHDGRLIGEITVFLHSVSNGQAEIGWAFHPDFQGNGYATEAAKRMLNWAFDEVGAHRVSAHLDPRNSASAAVATRLGMRLEAHFREDLLLKGAWGDTEIYAILQSEWKARAGG